MDEHLEEQIDVCDDLSLYFEEYSPESIVHSELVRYLVDVLRWLFRRELCMICGNFAFFPPLGQPDPPVAPDLAIIKGVPWRPLNCWRIGTTGPAPQVVFEILSDETWQKDLEEKPDLYGRLGVQEYFAYDPTPFPLAPATRERLFGWRHDPLLHRMASLVPNADGSLWSQGLGSFLVPDERMLRLTEAHAEARAWWEEARVR
jgi:Uma2 family endonuclease